MRLTVKEITMMSACISILFVQEQLLTFIPNVQFSTLLIILYSKVFPFKKAAVIILAHVFLDNLYMGSISMLNIVIPMALAWLIIPIIFNTIFKNVESVIKIAVIGYIFGHVYGWVYIPFQVLMTDITFKPYLIADIPFEIVMGISNAATVIWLYRPLKNILNRLNKQYNFL